MSWRLQRSAQRREKKTNRRVQSSGSTASRRGVRGARVAVTPPAFSPPRGLALSKYKTIILCDLAFSKSRVIAQRVIVLYCIIHCVIISTLTYLPSEYNYSQVSVYAGYVYLLGFSSKTVRILNTTVSVHLYA